MFGAGARGGNKLLGGLLFVAGVSGASGVALLAASAHLAGEMLRPAATLALAHAPVFLGMAALAHSTFRSILTFAAALLFLGLALFCGDMAMRVFAGERLFAMTAPTGGFLLIGGWLAIAALGSAAFFWPSKKELAERE